MKRILFILMILLSATLCHATHIVGGEVYYQYIGPDNASGKSQYKVFLRLFRDYNVPCGNNTNVACLPEEPLVAIYENGNGYRIIKNLSLPLTDDSILVLTDYPPCITTRPSVRYEVKTYSANVILADNDIGYILAYENCCRATTLNVLNNNPYSQQGLPGVTYDCSIPGKNLLATGHNSTASFNLKKPDLICYNSRFTLDYGATDPDRDSISFAFQSAYTSGIDFAGSNDGQPAEPPPYRFVTYNDDNDFSGVKPLGPNVSINPVTGQISGLSPAGGLYVVSVVVFEWRNGVNIAKHRKDFILRIENCNVPEAILNASYVTCNGLDLTFTNESSGININSYYWNFGDSSTLADTSLAPVTTYKFPKAGTYTVKLVTNRGGECADSANTEASVFPGFVPDFSVSGSCLQNAFSFTDKTTTAYGVVDSWRWNFGDPSTSSDTSHLQKPLPYNYNKTGTVTAQLIVTNSKGCIDTLNKEVNIYDKPKIKLPFRDTLMCNLDALQLSASTDAPAVYTWTPVSNIRDANTSSPTVNPQTTTTYYVKVDAGSNCVNNDSVRVNVIDHVTLSLGNDTAICLTDEVQLHAVTDGLRFLWTPSATLNDNTVKEPIAVPDATTTYHLQANVGSCAANDDITVHTAPYPLAEAGTATPICFGSTTVLSASYTGTNFTWSPSNTLLNANTLTPTAGPAQTTVYTFTSRDNSLFGCPKPVSDSVTVVVIPPISVFAGRDTNIVIGQTLQLQATGAAKYHWSPSTGMNNADIADPVVNLPGEVQRITYGVKGTTSEGCIGSDSVSVYQFKSLPQIFIPSAFTPDGDGINDILKPIVAGMKKFENFSIYNRLGQLLYTTPSIGQGWDGTYRGEKQPPGTYVFVATAIDYLDRHIIKRGTAVLIR